MNIKKIQGLKWLIFKWFGPREIQDLINHIISLNDHPESTGSIAIYPVGKFRCNISISHECEDDLEPLIFNTSQERASFQIGLSYGVELMGGITNDPTVGDYVSINKMQKTPTNRRNKKIH